jgi:hypothetical protein
LPVSGDDYHSPVRAAALGALSAVLLAGRSTAPPTPAVSSVPASAGRINPVISPPPVTPPIPPGNNLPGFLCADAKGGTTGNSSVTAARVGAQTGFDRFVLQFDGKVPDYTVKRQPQPVFTQDPSGQKVTLSGSAGVLVTVRTSTQASNFTGPTDFPHADFPVLKEARLVGDFEGTDSWGIGLSAAACMRTFTLTEPARLVVDFQTPTS